jgi:hypothetical protein
MGCLRVLLKLPNSCVLLCHDHHQYDPDGWHHLRSLLALSQGLTNAFDMVLRFVFDDVWGGAGTCREAARLIADYLVDAWDHRYACKHNGDVLALALVPARLGPAAPSRVRNY